MQEIDCLNNVLTLLLDTYNTSNDILENLDEEKLFNNPDSFQLYQLFLISNTKLKKVIETVELYQSIK
jgi:hypothetical protein